MVNRRGRGRGRGRGGARINYRAPPNPIAGLLVMSHTVHAIAGGGGINANWTVDAVRGGFEYTPLIAAINNFAPLTGRSQIKWHFVSSIPIHFRPSPNASHVMKNMHTSGWIKVMDFIPVNFWAPVVPIFNYTQDCAGLPA